ncbi:hypothetical protein HOK51_03625 [Candidatus Woesearchaeota archaeon]|jgi:hypothetical protein|nr:hypothetical protein [Candidatus Woesearchaeota archaeon]MBT6518911.1 hypothetical protein [Candidatus Woesearchaeota archaeon]MBT7367579.1 hypothetical protein [Candidatus Woesearchaeota archaeon]
MTDKKINEEFNKLYEPLKLGEQDYRKVEPMLKRMYGFLNLIKKTYQQPGCELSIVDVVASLDDLQRSIQAHAQAYSGDIATNLNEDDESRQTSKNNYCSAIGAGLAHGVLTYGSKSDDVAALEKAADLKVPNVYYFLSAHLGAKSCMSKEESDELEARLKDNKLVNAYLEVEKGIVPEPTLTQKKED